MIQILFDISQSCSTIITVFSTLGGCCCCVYSIMGSKLTACQFGGFYGSLPPQFVGHIAGLSAITNWGPVNCLPQNSYFVCGTPALLCTTY